MTERPTRIRHAVLWLTVAAYFITYFDRAVIASAMPFIRKEFGFSLEQVASILLSFQLAYSLFQIPGGWLGDIFGPRKTLTLIVSWWSLFTSLTAVSWSATSMVVFRFLFGMGEAGAFPNATRSLSRWMLPSERGYAQSLTHAGSRIAGGFTPYLVVWIISRYGWRAPFVIFGCVGLVWAVVWYVWYRDTPAEHRSVNKAELELIQKHIPPPKPRARHSFPWEILRSGNLWTLSMMYFCYGYIFNLYLQWFPTYLTSARNVRLTDMGIYASLPLLAGAFGNLLGGSISDWVGQRTGDLRFARKLVAIIGFLIAGAFILPATYSTSVPLCVALTCVAVFGLELTVGVSWAVPLDIGGDLAGSVSAVMNTLGNLGGSLAPFIFPMLVAGVHWDRPFLAGAGFCVLGALLFSRIDASKPIAVSMR